MKIDDMPAGREMDALVENAVFNNKTNWPTTGDFPITRYVAGICCLVPSYSTDIAAAWKVAIKYSMKVSCPTSCASQAHPSSRPFHATCEGLHDTYVFNFAETAPLAICRASLLAIGVEEVP